MRRSELSLPLGPASGLGLFLPGAARLSVQLFSSG